MRGKRVLVAAVAAASWAVVPAASAATTASVSGAELTVNGDANPNDITVRLPGSATDPPCAGPANCPDPVAAYPGAQKLPTKYVITTTDPGGITPQGLECVGVEPAIGTNAYAEVRCSRGGAAFGAFTVTINGGNGNDSVRHVAPLVATGEGNTGDVSFINGGAGDDTLVGSENNDTISGDAGNDLIEGYAGNDIVSGGSVTRTGIEPTGVDYNTGAIAPVSATAGDDHVFGGAGSDAVTDGDDDAGTPGADVLSGFSCPGTGTAAGVPCPVASDVINVDVPENDVDELFWGHRTKAVTVNTTNPAGQGGCPSTAACAAAVENEVVIGMRGVYSGSGNDALVGHAGAADVGNTFVSGAGDDRLEGLDGDDELVAGDGADTVLGGAGGDIISPGGHISSAPGAANTTLVGDGADTVDGGADSASGLVDSITYSGRTDDLTLNLQATSGWGAAGENDLVSGIENVTGGFGADTITAAGRPAVIESDPIAPEQPHAGEPVLPAPPPNGYFANDTVHVRNGFADTVDCGGDATDPDSDTVIAERTPADAVSANCETVDLPPPPPPASPSGAGSSAGTGGTGTGGRRGTGRAGGSAGGGGSTGKVRLSRARSAGKVRVKTNGSFRLSRIVIACPRGGKTCSYRTTVGAASAKLSTRSSYRLKSGKRSAARGGLSRKGLKRLKRRRSMKTVLTIRVVRAGKATTKRVTVTLLAPRKAKAAR